MSSAYVKPFKIVCVGDGAVGKTSLLLRYTTNTFSDDYQPTVFDNYSALVNIDRQVYNLSLWDTAGQEDYDSLRPLSYPQTDCFLLCYSVTMPNSLENVLAKWLPELRRYAPNTPIVLAGLKADVRENRAVIEQLAQNSINLVTLQQAEAVSAQSGAKAHVLASALNGRNVSQAMEACVRAVYSPPNPKGKDKKRRNPFSRLAAKFSKN